MKGITMGVYVESGTEDLDWTSNIDAPFLPVALRIHFIGQTGTADIVISLDAAEGEEYDCVLNEPGLVGVANDLNLVWTERELVMPSVHRFQRGDQIRVRWTNPNLKNTQWGLRLETASP